MSSNSTWPWTAGCEGMLRAASGMRGRLARPRKGIGYFALAPNLETVETKRPDPDELLQKVQEDEARQSRAKLKIFFGMAPGVGKTYAMLQDAQDRLDEGLDVLIGVVETHGRPETSALLAGLKSIPSEPYPTGA